MSTKEICKHVDNNEIFFFKFPATNYLPTFKVVEKLSAEKQLRLNTFDLEGFRSQKKSVDLSRVILNISHPIERLYHAYSSAVKKHGNSLSFEDFYSDPVRVNLYSRLFTQKNLTAFGLVLPNCFYFKNILLIESWLGYSIGRIPYYNIKLKEKLNIDQNDIEKIKKLHADDVALYEEILKQYEKNWISVTKHKKIQIPRDKNVMIHVGPPKTGTSAIQFFLQNNTSQLRKEGIFYPDHTLDTNNISSGNANNLIGIDSKSGMRYFDEEIARHTIEEFVNSSSNVLLLSSEHFFYYLPWLFALIDEAEFLFYIRHPLSNVESGFHQEVKRHKRILPFNIPKKVRFYHLEVLAEISSEFAPKIKFGYFEKSLFVDQSLIADFLSMIPEVKKLKPEDRVINTQYCYEAIEFMRACNSFATDRQLTVLDKHLQRFSQSQPKFSFFRIRK